MPLIAAAARRRGPGVGGWRAQISQADMDYHGAGYPLTYRFTVPDQPGLTAQWRGESTPWYSLPTPSGRFDGINAARFDGTDAYLSAAFLENQPDLYLRVIDNQGDEVGTFAEIVQWYDDRVPVIFTYDDTKSAQPGALSAHRDNDLWASIGINAGVWSGDDWTISPQQFAADVALGCCEPVNHSLTHRSAITYVSAADADTEIKAGAEALLGITPGPPQSRGRVHAYIVPHGNVSAYMGPAIVRAKHLIYRMVGENYWTTITTNIDGTIVYRDSGASVSTTGYAGNTDADEFIAGVEYAVTNRVRCLLYSYTYWWMDGYESGSPFRRMLETIGARDDIWSVGYGHYALYLRTASQVTVTAPTP